MVWLGPLPRGNALVVYCGITYFRACLIFAYFALWPMREFKTARKLSLNVIFFIPKCCHLDCSWSKFRVPAHARI